MNDRGIGRILLTGATGFLGSHLTAELLARGFDLTVLARPRGEVGPEARVRRVLEWLRAGREAGIWPKVLEGSFERSGLGLTGPAPVSGFDQIIHCASDTSFSERKRLQVERANIAGLESMIDFAARTGCSHFHYISTAYVAGKKEGLCRESLVENDRFHNVYEESKYRAERLAFERCRKFGISLSIYRPSIVYGDSRSGRTMRFNALYYPIRTVLFLKGLYETDIREQGGDHAAAAGVKETGGGELFMPIRVETSEEGGLNLIPVDHFVNAFTALMEKPEGIFHLVNPRLTTIDDLISYLRPCFGIEGPEAVRNGAPASPRNPLEALFDSYLEIYGPYMRDTRIFEDTDTRAFLASKGIECPPFDYEMFKRCMDYAISVDWGKKLQL